MKLEKRESIKEFAVAAIDRAKAKPGETFVKLALIVMSIYNTVFCIAIGATSAAFFIPLCACISVGAVVSLCFDIKDTLFENFKKHHTLEKLSNKDIVLVLEATHDYNQAFQIDEKALFETVKAKYPIAFEKVSHVLDITKHIVRAQELGNSIKSLWIRAHGSCRGMTLSRRERLSVDNVHLLVEYLSKVDPLGTIVLDSCGTANEKNGVISIARKISHIAQGPTVFASPKTNRAGCLQVDSENPLQVSFMYKNRSAKSAVLKRVSKVINNAKECIYAFTRGSRIFKGFVRPVTVTHRFNSASIAV